MTTHPRRLIRFAGPAAALALLSSVAAPQKASASPLRVLFIGNSYTYFNDVASVVGDLARAAGEKRPYVAEEVLVGGSTLERHLTQGDAMKFVARGWDVVIIQEQSTRPLDAPGLMLRDAVRFRDAVKQAGAKLMLYETWAREAAPATQDSLSHMYHRTAELSGGTVAHVGEAWAAFRAKETVEPGAHSALFFTDGSHPSEAGSYLAACVIYATLYGRSPVGLPPVSRRTHQQPPSGPPAGAPRDTLGAPLARQLQELAWKAVHK